MLVKLGESEGQGSHCQRLQNQNTGISETPLSGSTSSSANTGDLQKLTQKSMQTSAYPSAPACHQRKNDFCLKSHTSASHWQDITQNCRRRQSLRQVVPDFSPDRQRRSGNRCGDAAAELMTMQRMWLPQVISEKGDLHTLGASSSAFFPHLQEAVIFSPACSCWSSTTLIMFPPNQILKSHCLVRPIQCGGKNSSPRSRHSECYSQLYHL